VTWAATPRAGDKLHESHLGQHQAIFVLVSPAGNLPFECQNFPPIHANFTDQSCRHSYFLFALLLVALSLGWLRLRTGDLRQSILLHSLNNTLSILLLNILPP